MNLSVKLNGEIACPPDRCPVCGERLAGNARACPECGADERAGWNEEATRYDGLDLPDEAFDQAGEGGQGLRPKSGSGWLLVAVLVLVAVIVAFILR